MGVKAYFAVAAAAAGMGIASVFLPSTAWIYRTAAHAGEESSVRDYGDSPEADLLELADEPSNGYPRDNSIYLDRRSRLTEAALRLGKPGDLSIAIRKVGQGTTFSQPINDPRGLKKELARLQLRLAEAGSKQEPDNAFWPAMEAASWRLLGDRGREDEAFQRAARGTHFDDQASYEANLRIKLLETSRGKLGSQQEVAEFSAILLPHFASIKQLCRYRVGSSPLSKSAAQREEVARLGLLLAKTSTNLIGSFVGVAVSTFAVTERNVEMEDARSSPKHPREYSKEEIEKFAPAQSAALLQALDLQQNKEEFTQMALANQDDDWRKVSDLRPQIAAFNLLICLLLPVPLLLLARRLASWQETEHGARALAGLSALLPAFASVMRAADQRVENFVYPLFAASAVIGVLAACLAVSRSKIFDAVLLALNGLVFCGFFAAGQGTAAHGFGWLFCAALPPVIFGLRGSEKPWGQLLSWTGWAVWVSALVYGATTNYYAAGEWMGAPAGFQSVSMKVLCLAGMALIGGIGAAAISTPGAKGLWWRGIAVQAAMGCALLGALVVCIREDKTMATYIPREVRALAKVQETLPAPAPLHAETAVGEGGR